MLLDGVTHYIPCSYTGRELQFPQGGTHHHAHRTKIKRLQTWRLGTGMYQLQQQRHWPLAPKEVEYSVCRRLFRKESDKAMHKCSTEREKPVLEQLGAVQC